MVQIAKQTVNAKVFIKRTLLAVARSDMRIDYSKVSASNMTGIISRVYSLVNVPPSNFY